MKTFLVHFVTGFSQRTIWTASKTDSRHVASLADNFCFYKAILYFSRKRFCISASRTIHLTLNLQARRYIKIKYYNIHTCNFTPYLKKLKVVYLRIQIFSEIFPQINNKFIFENWLKCNLSIRDIKYHIWKYY